MKIELKEIEKEMEYCDLHERVGRLKSMNNYSFHCLYTSKKSVVLASIQKKAKLLFSDDENSKTSNDFNLWVFGGKKDVSNEYRSIRVLNMTTTSTTNFMTRVHEFPVHDVDNHYRTNSYMALIPNKNLENNCDQQQRVSMLLSHVESMNGVDRIFFHIAHVDRTSSTNSTNSSKHKNFELERLVFNNIPVPPSIQKCVFRPFLHCYYDKYGHRKGIYIVNSHVMYFIHLDYESVSFCFQWKILLNNETHALSDIEIITQSIVYL
ncbi:hypothetical protein C9374_011977 [Naegleria lovaniensis]|uniref:Uncharacterized protein n=1 Tax=Naegleria lovaniensis TaxID=51637 RepID=A0AA88GEE4_NAELO|nr:uncharacterized protein C9374_011977 [Naegleria lovaniensis]KAG2373688.1 hypothetical protein C9374_011977 [Naegleria lovaniensis]